MRTVWFAVVVLVCLDRPIRVGAAPICVHGQAECHIPSLAELFDRVLQQSSRMHGISTDMHSDFGQHFFPNRNHIGKRKCHTYRILTPDDKENAQRLGREELTEVILRLLGAWGDPLTQLHQSMSEDQNQDFNHHSSNRALEMIDMVQELKDGVSKVAEKMKLQGVIGNTLGFIPQESLLPSSPFSSYKQGALSSMDHHDLLYCFRRDSNKVKNYLRILKCTSLPEVDC